MTISYVGAASANATTVDLSGIAVQAGDLIIIGAYRNNNNTAPTIPADWSVLGSANGNNTNSLAAGWRRASSSTPPASGTWANATQLIAGVWRGSVGLILPGNTMMGGAAAIAAGGNANYPALTPLSNFTNHWIAAFAGHRSIDSDIEVAPTGLTNRTSVVGGAAGEWALHDSNGNLSAWASTNYTLTTGTSGGHRTFMFELSESDYLPSSGGVTVPVRYFGVEGVGRT